MIIVSHDYRIREAADRVLWLEDGRFKDIGALARDPVCGMGVERETAASVLYDGHTYYFCSAGCRSEFLDQPAKFTRREATAARSEQPQRG